MSFYRVRFFFSKKINFECSTPLKNSQTFRKFAVSLHVYATLVFMNVFFLFFYSSTLLQRLSDEKAELTVDDFNAISRTCKGQIDSHRKAWKQIFLAEQKERGKGRDDRTTPLLEYRKQLEAKISEHAKDVIDIVQKKLINRTNDTAMRGLLFKMTGDYWRYLAEVQRGYDRRESANKALAAYQEAEDLIVACTGPAAASRLSLMLNMAMFKFEILSEPDEALEMLKKAYDEGVACVDSLHEEAYADSILMLQIIHRTIFAWSKNK